MTKNLFILSTNEQKQIDDLLKTSIKYNKKNKYKIKKQIGIPELDKKPSKKKIMSTKNVMKLLSKIDI